MVIAVDELPYRPSAAEALTAEYGHEWEIWRDVLPNGKHGDWIAQRLPPGDDPEAETEKLRAANIEDLAEQLQEADRITDSERALQQLAEELKARGYTPWPHGNDERLTLTSGPPDCAATVKDEAIWCCGQNLGPATDTSSAADRLVEMLGRCNS